MVQQLRSVGIVSCVKISALLYAILGLLIGAILSVVAVLGFALRPAESGGALIGLLLGAGAVLFFPLFYGIIGAVTGLIFSALYNLVAKATGGIELELDDSNS